MKSRDHLMRLSPENQAPSENVCGTAEVNAGRPVVMLKSDE